MFHNFEIRPDIDLLKQHLISMLEQANYQQIQGSTHQLA